MVRQAGDWVEAKESEKRGTTRYTLRLKDAQEVAKKGSIVEERTAPYKIIQSFSPMFGARSYSEQMLEAIDQVHGVQGITDLGIRKVHLEHSYGEFEYLKREIRISTDAPYPLCTGFHEVGHALDALFLNSVSGYTLSQGEASLIAADARRGVLRDWFSVAFESPPVKAFYEVLRHSSSGSADYLDASYYLDPAEVWARSYEQFIAQNCKDLQAKEEFSLKRRTKVDFGEAKLRVYWTYQEFVPIQAEIRKAFRSIGWL